MVHHKPAPHKEPYVQHTENTDQEPSSKQQCSPSFHRPAAHVLPVHVILLNFFFKYHHFGSWISVNRCFSLFGCFLGFFFVFLILGKRSLQVLQPKENKSLCTSYFDIHKNEYVQAILSKSCIILCKFFNTEQSDSKYFILRLFLPKLLLKEF